MKINHIIREKRKELSLTQEQVAEFLGVSTPAVNKWEKGGSYPDITLLPALARLLKTDLNTLLSFQDDLSDVEIVNFVDELDKIVQENGYEIAFQMAIDKIHDFPTCENLIYSVVMYLTGALILYNVSESEQYQKVFEAFYEQLSHSQNTEIKEMAISMLISYSLNRKDFSKAEELINTLPSSSIDKEERIAILYTEQEKFLDALKIWEHRILNSITEIQTALMNMLVKTRMTEEEYAEFAERLSACNMSQAEFIRQAITGAAIRPIITVSPVNDELLAAVGKLTAEYGKIGGNLNQIARTLNEWHSPYPQLAGEVRAAVSDLAALKFEVLQKVGDAVGNIQTYQL